MKSWHVWAAAEDGRPVVEMRHMDALNEADIVWKMGEYPEHIEPCDGKGFYCRSRGAGAKP